MAIVGLPDKAVSEARERVRSALIASGLALPARRITVNLAPADLPKEGSHYDLSIALGLMAAIGAIPPDALSGFTVLGELGLDGSIAPVAGVLPAAIGANSRDEGLICPAACGSEAAWASPDIQIIAARSLIQIANHFKGTQVLSRPQPAQACLADRTVKAYARGVFGVPTFVCDEELFFGNDRLDLLAWTVAKERPAKRGS
jgi:magnesium chelatase family protein